MTAKEFFDILRQAKGKFTTVDMKSQGKTYPDGCELMFGFPIRTQAGECPICYVANVVLGEQRFWIDAWAAARLLKLDDQFATFIRRAADDFNNASPRVRHKLLAVLGLSLD